MTDLAAAPARVLAEAPVPGDVPKLELAEWAERFGLVAGITGRGAEAAPFDLGLWSATPVKEAMARWRRFRASFPGHDAFVMAHQVHGAAVMTHGEARGWVLHEGLDGHVTARAGTLLLVTVADCTPVYLAAPGGRAWALLHAGWRGAAAGIVTEGVRQLTALAGCGPEALALHAGVSISGPCYEVGPEVFAAFGQAAPDSGHGPFDVRAAIVEEARRLGVRDCTVSPWCTAREAGRFFSHRASGGQDGRMVAYLGRSASSIVDGPTPHR